METFKLKSIYSGNSAESMSEPNENGEAWQITTSKNSRGQVVCSAVLGHLDGNMFSYEMFSTKRLTLASAEGRATEKIINEVHSRGLENFQAIQAQEAQTKPAPYVIEVGQIVYTDGPFDSNRRAICEVRGPGKYRSVFLDGSGFRNDDRLKPITEKHGIGVYYAEGDKMSPAEVSDLVYLATENEAKAKAEKEAAENETERQRLAAIEAGRKVIAAIPAGAVAVIVAERHKDESDTQSDYHNYRTEETIYLSFSDHKKDLFSEMRKAADKYEHTAHLGTGKGIFTPFVKNTSDNDFEYKGRRYFRKCETFSPDEIPTFTTLAEAQSYIDNHPLKFEKLTSDAGQEITLVWDIETKEIEHREKYSMGAGYYLGESNYHGWVVKKRNLYGAESLEALQIAAGEGRYLCNVTQVSTPDEIAPAVNYAPVPTVAGELNIIDYSPKAIAVIGDTKPVKDQLMALGGSFNARLSCGAGWIFSKKRLDAVQTFLNNLTVA